MKTIETDDYILTFDDSPEAKDRIYQIALAWFREVGMYNGEQIHQSDTTYEEAPEILTKIAEEGFQFKAKWKEEF